MWIVRTALARPYTFVALALLIVIAGGAAIATMPVDIFPYIDIPIVSVMWTYNGMSSDEMEKRIVTSTNARSPLQSTTSSTSNRSRTTVSASSEIYLPAEREDRFGNRAGNRDLAAIAEAASPGITPPLIVKYRRFQRSNSPIGIEQRVAKRAGTLRSRE